MKVTITHKHIFDAIKYNHLVAGQWFEIEGGYDDDEDDTFYKPNCNACLVGSTVRRAAKKGTDIEKLDALISNCVPGDVTGFSSSAEEEVRRGRYLTALSNKFENTVASKAALKYGVTRDELTDKMRRNTKLSAAEKKDLVKWVKIYIPKSFTIGE